MKEFDQNYYSQASESERETMRTWVKGLLREGEVVVEFEKADGEQRRMTCTLQESTIPLVNTESKTAREPNPNTCVVWDINANGWRSFRWDRMKRIEFTIE